MSLRNQVRQGDIEALKAEMNTRIATLEAEVARLKKAVEKADKKATKKDDES